MAVFMKPCVSGARFTALLLVLAAAFPYYSFAQIQPTSQLKETVISASRTPTRTDELVSDVTVVTRAEIEKYVGRTLPELLSRLAGVQFSATGGLGKSSSVSIRGSEARHTILLIDGVRYGSARTGAPVWDNIPVDMIKRIEILKGPLSALYGSDTVGGVVQVFMRKGQAGFKPYAAVTLGSESRAQRGTGLTGGAGDVSFASSAQKTPGAGFSATDTKAGVATFNPGRDGFEQKSFSGSIAYQINPSFKLDVGLVYADIVYRSVDGLTRYTRYSSITNDAHTTGLAGGFSVTPQWRVNASYGTSFVAPSFNQLYFPGFGNSNLQPEKRRNSDFGVTWSDFGHGVKFVKYDNRIRGFITNSTLPVNIPQASIDGVTLFYGGTSDGLTLSASAGALNPHNELTGKRLPRRSSSQLHAAADYAVGAWTFGGALLRTGESFNDVNNTQKLEGYTVGDVYADNRFSKDWNVQAKINNVTAKVCETILGYNQLSRGVFVASRWQSK